MHCIYTSMQITEKIKGCCLNFSENPLHERITPYHPMGFRYYQLPSFITTTLMGFRNYHLQPYKLLPPSSGITTFSLTYYYPH